MRVVHVHTAAGERGGGGGIAMQRLHLALLAAEVDSRILARCACPHSSEIKVLTSLRPKGLEKRLGRLTGSLGLNDVHRLGSFKLADHEFCQNADVINFHGMHSGTFSYLALPRVSRSIPCVFTLHDMWAITGHCAYSYSCDRWKTGCGSCPYPESHPPIRRDATWLEWKLKKWAYDRSRLSLITKSRWMTKMLSESMLRDHRVEEIPYGLRTDVYSPRPPRETRAALGIPPDAHVIAVIAQNLADTRKGGDLLIRALRALPDRIRSKTHLLILGSNSGAIPAAAGLPATELGYVRSDSLKALAYSAADLMALTSRADNSPLVIMESHACGTPVVAFRTGGIPERVRTGETGYIAEQEDVEGYAAGITGLMEDPEQLARLRVRCRQTAVAEYSIEREAREEVEFYKTLAR